MILGCLNASLLTSDQMITFIVQNVGTDAIWFDLFKLPTLHCLTTKARLTYLALPHLLNPARHHLTAKPTCGFLGPTPPNSAMATLKDHVSSIQPDTAADRSAHMVDPSD